MDQESEDEVAEWLRRTPAKCMGFARVGSNPILVVKSFFAFSWSSKQATVHTCTYERSDGYFLKPQSSMELTITHPHRHHSKP